MRLLSYALGLVLPPRLRTLLDLALLPVAFVALLVDDVRHPTERREHAEGTVLS